MDFGALKWKVILATFMLVLIALVGLQSVYTKVYLQIPVEKILSDNRLAMDTRLYRTDKQLLIEITLAQTGNFYRSYQELKGIFDEKYGAGKYQIKITDTRDELLEEVWYKSQLVIQEAITRGNYQEMSSRIEEFSTEAGLTKGDVFVDQEAVYLQLEHGTKYLYEIIPRQVVGGDNS